MGLGGPAHLPSSPFSRYRGRVWRPENSIRRSVRRSVGDSHRASMLGTGDGPAQFELYTVRPNMNPVFCCVFCFFRSSSSFSVSLFLFPLFYSFIFYFFFFFSFLVISVSFFFFRFFCLFSFFGFLFLFPFLFFFFYQ